MSSPKNDSEKTISGIDVMRGVGASKAKPFWADAWSRVVERRAAQFGLVWIGIIGFFAIFAPIIANGLPLWTVELSEEGTPTRSYSPIYESLTATDILLLIGGLLGPLLMVLPLATSRQRRLGVICSAAILAGGIVILISLVQYMFADASQDLLAWDAFPWIVSFGAGGILLASLFWVAPFNRMSVRLLFSAAVVVVTALVCGDRWVSPAVSPESFVRAQTEGTQRNIYTIIPWSPTQSSSEFFSRAPASTVSGAYMTVADDQLDDGIAFFIRTVAFNLSPRIEGLPLSGQVSSAIAEVLGDDDPANLEKLAETGVSRGFIERLAAGAAEAAALVDSVELKERLGRLSTDLAGDKRVTPAFRDRLSAISSELAAAGQAGSMEWMTEMIALYELEGVSSAFVDRFAAIGASLERYRTSIIDADSAKARRAAQEAVTLVGAIEAANRNARLMIADAGDELVDKVDERINYFAAARGVESISYGERDFYLGSDPIGRDVLSQMLHACRLSISIGLVSTGISVLIGIVIGSLMGYFGGWVDLVLSRLVEIFMAIPVLFLLIVAASVLPRNTYVMMAIIGCVTWTGSARFIRAEFLKLRNQDFVQSCRAVGLPLHSTLFRHMLPNGITPVLVQASFGIAAAIIAEATLSYLGLGPYGQSSWGKLLSLTTGETGVFLWWMAVFPGAAIFFTVLAYNVLGENFRDAIDPKMRKAAH